MKTIFVSLTATWMIVATPVCGREPSNGRRKCRTSHCDFPQELVKNTGLRRTWLNLMSCEGARGQEYNGGHLDTGIVPDRTRALLFPCLLSGPFDYAPGILHFDFRAPRRNNRVPSTLANQLALYVVLHSPVQMADDLPEHYDEHPDALRFIQDFPTDREESKTLQRHIGDYAVVARQDRKGTDWYLGAINNADARMLRVRYDAQVYADGPGADQKSAPERITISRRTVMATDLLDLSLTPGGGQAIRFKAFL